MTRATEKVKRRTTRACDRCRLKKAKCDGSRNCKTCQLNGSACLYASRRGRDARNYYWQMCDMMEQAMKILYIACREGSGFPGIPLEETRNPITTITILEGLGLLEPTTNLQITDRVVSQVTSHIRCPSLLPTKEPRSVSSSPRSALNFELVHSSSTYPFSSGGGHLEYADITSKTSPTDIERNLPINMRQQLAQAVNTTMGGQLRVGNDTSSTKTFGPYQVPTGMDMTIKRDPGYFMFHENPYSSLPHQVSPQEYQSAVAGPSRLPSAWFHQSGTSSTMEYGYNPYLGPWPAHSGPIYDAAPVKAQAPMR